MSEDQSVAEGDTHQAPPVTGIDQVDAALAKVDLSGSVDEQLQALNAALDSVQQVLRS
ncbi:MAG: hypothetical protein LBU38_07930 [Propionibacteriaceae bacterium]|nr:hypothetical protein [Propionibacteriaceae bacterium]